MMQQTDLAAFAALKLDSGLSLSYGGVFPTRVRAWHEDSVALEANATHFLFAWDGTSKLETSFGNFPLAKGMFASTLEGFVGRAGSSGTGLIVSRLDVRGLFQLGGPIETEGRLRYIDGCTDTLLVSPPLRGDPCFNHLHIPKRTHQTEHTHPSLRVGIIANGHGRCVTREREYALAPGLVFVIGPDQFHSFVTDDDALDVVVYHPDSDTGPTHEDHPMINRTIITRA